MSVLIKGMEMPQSCWRCPLCLTVDPDTYRCMPTGKEFESTFDAIDHIVLSCPLVEVEEAEESDDCLTNFLIAIAKEREREKDETIGEVRIGNYRVTVNRFSHVWRYEPEGDKE